ncbi:MAG: DUF1993 domain-containing protein [Pseudomonadales bacterium]
MAVSLYDLSTVSFLQVLNAVDGFLEKGRNHLEAEGVDLDEIVSLRLIDDMNPFQFQVISVAHHSMGALKGLEAGEFAPPSGYGEPDYAGLQALVKEAIATVETFDAAKVAGLEGGQLVFKLGANELPFTAENFIMSFSLPNFYFHAATTYDFLRMKGVPLGKRDFLGGMRMGV